MDSGKKRYGIARITRISFGIFMILVYWGMGALMLLNFFNIKQVYAISLGVLFVVYGVFRGYRLYKGNDYWRN